ncbi:MAG TPA: phosphoglucosamine mutase [Thermoguttaceae bacterium]|nr:phosphoglucosamine mutase [Thermoguttaceae bacterium]
MEPIISVSGLRGVVGETLTPDIAARYVAAFASTAPSGVMLVGRDSRPSGAMLAQAVHAALRAVGHATIDLGICPTPTVGLLVRHHQAAGAIQITASHNPPPYNGLKLFSNDGRVIPAAPGQKVLQQYRAGKISWARHDRIGATSVCDDVYSAHLEAVLTTVDVERIRKNRFAVLLDSNHGAGGPLGRLLLEALGCRVTILGEAPDGQFEHKAEPTAENLAEVLSAVPGCGAQIGFCQDPDADRLAVIDAAGRYLGEEYTVAIIAQHVLNGRRGPVVTNCSTSRMTEAITKQHDQPFFRSAVGEANVVDMMLAKDAIFGGEGNGGPIDPRVGLVRDSFVGMAQLLDAMAARELSIRQLADELPRYAIVKTTITLAPDRVAAALDALEKHFDTARADRLDGLRLDWPESWLLVRPSNTEPIVRAVAEAPTEDEARRLCDEAARVLQTLA